MLCFIDITKFIKFWLPIRNQTSLLYKLNPTSIQFHEFKSIPYLSGRKQINSINNQDRFGNQICINSIRKFFPEHKIFHFFSPLRHSMFGSVSVICRSDIAKFSKQIRLVLHCIELLSDFEMNFPPRFFLQEFIQFAQSQVKQHPGRG